MTSSVTALIAEDEPLLAASLQKQLQQLWPELRIVSCVDNGQEAVDQALALQPDIVFLDIQMPVLSGMDAAAVLADEWTLDLAFPQLVFVTAYDHYAVEAFEQHAVDYLLKPIKPERLKMALERLQQNLQHHPSVSADTQLLQLHALLQSVRPEGQTPKLTTITASVGQTIHLIPLEEVLYFEAADKYVRVLTLEREYLIRTPLKDLIPQLDQNQFWQIHRSTLVRASAIETVTRDEYGKSFVSLRGSSERLAVSRLYAHLFKAM